MDALSRAHLILDEVAQRTLADVPDGTVLFDAHTHLGDDIDGMRGRPDEMLAMFDQLGITGSFAFCLDEPDRVPAFTAANDRTLAFAAAEPDRIVPFVRLDLEERPIEEAIRCLDLGARGIKLHPRAQKFSVGDKRLDAVFALAVERDIPILIHGGRGLPPIGDHLAALVDRYADVRLIIAHAGIADLGGLAGHFAHVPGVFFDTSLWGVIDLLDLMRQVAPQQILFATDYPYGRGPNQLLLALRAATVSGFSDAEIRGMLGGTALAIRDGEPIPTLTAPRGVNALTLSLPLARIHQYISMAVPRLWMRQPDPAGGLGLALNAAHEANVDGVPDADLIRRALSVAAEIWEGIGEIDDREESERTARPARMLIHTADILAVTTPAAG
ncbi:amidohydrolase family protein [Gaiella sp.]|uniref:amidohydrolase family protein n=1 Tax=Gaiella sp. TaxID=2663207 RepID=UPI003264AB64